MPNQSTIRRKVIQPFVLRERAEHDAGVARRLKHLGWLVPQSIADALPKIDARGAMNSVLKSYPLLTVNGFAVNPAADDRSTMLDDNCLLQFVVAIEYLKCRVRRDTINPELSAKHAVGECHRRYAARNNNGGWVHIEMGIFIAAVIASNIPFMRIPESTSILIALELDADDMADNKAPTVLRLAKECTKAAWAKYWGVEMSQIGEPTARLMPGVQ